MQKIRRITILDEKGEEITTIHPNINLDKKKLEKFRKNLMKEYNITGKTVSILFVYSEN